MANAPIESKVRAATGVAAALGLLLAVLNAVLANSQLLGSLPAWVQSMVTLVAPPLAVLTAGWAAPHNQRPAAPDTPAEPTYLGTAPDTAPAPVPATASPATVASDTPPAPPAPVEAPAAV